MDCVERTEAARLLPPGSERAVAAPKQASPDAPPDAPLPAPLLPLLRLQSPDARLPQECAGCAHGTLFSLSGPWSAELSALAVHALLCVAECECGDPGAGETCVAHTQAWLGPLKVHACAMQSCKAKAGGVAASAHAC